MAVVLVMVIVLVMTGTSDILFQWNCPRLPSSMIAVDSFKSRFYAHIAVKFAVFYALIAFFSFAFSCVHILVQSFGLVLLHRFFSSVI